MYTNFTRLLGKVGRGKSALRPAYIGTPKWRRHCTLSRQHVSAASQPTRYVKNQDKPSFVLKQKEHIVTAKNNRADQQQNLQILYRRFG